MGPFRIATLLPPLCCCFSSSSNTKTASPVDERVRLEQYMSREAFEFVELHWGKELEAARSQEELVVTWKAGSVVILGELYAGGCQVVCKWRLRRICRH